MCSYTPTVGTAAPLRSTHGCAIRMHAGPAAILLYSRGPAAPCHHGAPLPSPDGIYIFKLINIVITAHKSRSPSSRGHIIQGTYHPGYGISRWTKNLRRNYQGHITDQSAARSCQSLPSRKGKPFLLYREKKVL
jgi:hypothetical protein